ncbi:MAG: ankyrin repeat domain-containing protein, partial [Bacteroidota bacterium]
KANPSVEQIKRDIQQGNDAAQLNEFAFDAVSWALIEKVDNATIKFLLEQEGNEVNKITHDGRTYIFWAAYRDNLEIMNYLLERGARTDIIDSHGYSLMNFAAVTGQQNQTLYDWCIANGSNPKIEKNHDGANALLLVAPFIQDDNLIDYFVEKGIDLHSKDEKGNGIFNYAAKKGNIDVLNLLIDLGVGYKELNLEGGNAFISASQGTRGSSNSLETYKYLEKLGLEPNITTDSGFTPLHALAYKNKDLDIFEYFVSKGVDVNQPDMNGNTAFMNAAYRNDLPIVSYLLNYVESINTYNKKGISPLMRAVQSNDLEVVRFLLEKGASIDHVDEDGNSLSFYLIESYSEKKHDDFIKKLQLLQEGSLDFSKIQSNGDGLWHLAVKTNSLKLLQKVGKLDLPINLRNDDGNTALHLAAMKAQNLDILKFLLSQGADKSIKTEFGESVFDLANENELLQEKGAGLSFLQ